MGFYTNPVAAGSSGTYQSVFTNASQSSNFTAAANTIYSVNAASAAVTVTLPTSTQYQSIIIKKSDISLNSVTMSGTINGVASSLYALTKQNQTKQLYADGSGGWNIIDGDVDPATLTSTITGTGYLSTVGTSKMTVGTTAPSSPSVGDLWIDTN